MRALHEETALDVCFQEGWNFPVEQRAEIVYQKNYDGPRLYKEDLRKAEFTS